MLITVKVITQSSIHLTTTNILMGKVNVHLRGASSVSNCEPTRSFTHFANKLHRCSLIRNVGDTVQDEAKDGNQTQLQQYRENISTIKMSLYSFSIISLHEVLQSALVFVFCALYYYRMYMRYVVPCAAFSFEKEWKRCFESRFQGVFQGVSRLCTIA